MPDLDRRVAIVNEHMRLENAHDFQACIGEFGRPRYEVLADDAVFDGSAGVERFLLQNRRAFPDFRFDPTRVDPAGDVVMVEGMFKGTQDGCWRGLPATGRRVEFPMCLIFEFEGDVMVNERIYFDLGTPLRQLGVAYDPDSVRGKIFTFLNHPTTICRAGLRMARLRIMGRAR